MSAAQIRPKTWPVVVAILLNGGTATALPEADESQRTHQISQSISERETVPFSFPRFYGATKAGLNAGPFTSGVDVGLELGVAHSEHFEIGFTYTQGRVKDGTNLTRAKGADRSGIIDGGYGHSEYFTVTGRYFVMKHLAIGLGIGHRSYSLLWRTRADEALKTEDATYYLRTASLVGSAGLTSKWFHKNGLYLGCDWVVFEAPLSASSSIDQRAVYATVSARPTHWLTSFDLETERSARNLSDSINFRFLTFSLGYIL